MKFITILLLICIIPIILSSQCDWLCTDFHDVSGHYINAYGDPEDIYKYYSKNYQMVEWWWWTKGAMVCFIHEGSGRCGWEVDHTYYFSPIY